MQIDSKKYYDQHWSCRGGLLAKDRYKNEQIDTIIGMMPLDVHTILDIGCGDGAITNRLNDQYNVVAIDRSKEAIKHLEQSIVAIQCDAAKLPLTESAFDLVFSSEMIEHISDHLLEDVISEIKRVSKRYILISVPNDEKLRKRFTLCMECNHEFHIYSHFQSFNLNNLKLLS